MKTLKSKYSQGNRRNRWKTQQCQSEKIYFDYQKDCNNCEAREYCYSENIQPYYVNIANSVLVFADSFENAKEYAGKGHGWLIDKEIISGLPVEIKVADDCVTFQACND